MKKRLLLAIGIGVCLAVGLVLALPALVNLRAVKTRAVAELSKATGRRVTIDHLHLTLFPWLGVRIDGATIGNAPGFGKSPFATVDDAVVEVKVLPLLAHRLVVRRVILTDLTLNLATRGHGVDNWQFGAPSHPAPVRPHRPPAHGGVPSVLSSLKAAGISVRNATIYYTDLATHTHYAVTSASLRTGAIAPGSPIHLVAGGRIHTPRTTLPFSLMVRARAHGNAYTLAPLHMAVGTLTLNGHIDAVDGPAGWSAHGSLRIPRFAPRPLLETLHVAYAPKSPKVLHALSAHADFSYDAQGVLLAPLTVHLDQSVLTGRLAMQIHPRLYRAQLTINQFAPANYLPKTPAHSSVSTPTKTTAPPAPSRALTNLDLRGNFRIGKLFWDHMTLTGVSVPLSIYHGKVTVDPVHADLYGGTFAGRALVNEAGSIPALSIKGQLHNVQVGPLLRATRLSTSFSGILHGQINLHARGRTTKAIERTLSGHARIAIAHGVLRGLDLDVIAADPRLAAGAHRLKKASGTAFSHLHASAVLINGVAHTHDLSIQTARASIHGQGTINLPSRSLDYLLQVSLPSGFTVPVSIKGPFTKVQFGIAVRRLLGERGTQKALHSTVRHLGHALQNIFGFH